MADVEEDVQRRAREMFAQQAVQYFGSISGESVTIAQYQEQLRVAIQRVAQRQAELARAVTQRQERQARRARLQAQMEEAYDQIMAQPEVESVGADGPSLAVDTHPILIGPLGDGTTRRLGRFSIEFIAGQTLPHFTNKDLEEPLEDENGEYQAPQIDGAGVPCFGNIQELVQFYQGEVALGPTVVLCLEYLKAQPEGDFSFRAFSFPMAENSAQPEFDASETFRPEPTHATTTDPEWHRLNCLATDCGIAEEAWHNQGTHNWCDPEECDERTLFEHSEGNHQFCYAGDCDTLRQAEHGAGNHNFCADPEECRRVAENHALNDHRLCSQNSCPWAGENYREDNEEDDEDEEEAS